MKSAVCHLAIKGMSCQACAARIEKVLNRKTAIHEASVNFASEQASIHYDGNQISVDELIQLIEKTGFQAALIEENQPISTEKIAQNEKWRLILLLGMVALFFPGMLGMLVGRHDWMLPVAVQMCLASIVQLGLAYPFYRGAWASLKAGSANMDVLVSLGTVSIYIYSLFAMLMAWHDVYFEASVMVIAFVSLGKYWEKQTKQHSLNSLSLLLQLTPKTVQKWSGEQWQTIELAEIQQGDRLRAIQGESIAADGSVLAGEAWADERHLTGESEPVFKTIGSTVLAGSTMMGSIEYQAEKMGKQTLLGDMVMALEEAQNSKAPIARLADRVSAIFVPIVLLIAVLTGLLTFWITGNVVQAIVHAVAVLVVACPCALGLATPAAIMAGMGVAVRHGVWFKNAAVLEQTGQVNTVVMDKTGTLTEGHPQVLSIWVAEGVQEQQVLCLAAALEQYTMHPIATAILNRCHQDGQTTLPHVHQLQIEVGAGVSGEVENWGKIWVGKPEFCGVNIPNLDGVWNVASIVAVSSEQGLLGLLALADAPKADARHAIALLQEQQIETYMMSGDRVATVAYIAQQLGIQHYDGNQLPRDKAQAVEKLMQAGKIVAMVGDGVNDAPALAKADIGVAVYGSTDIAKNSADIVLMKHSAMQMTHAIFIARATLKTIRQNLFFAFIYNVIGIPLAAFGLLTPALAGMMMTLSSISVLLNALKLKRLKLSIS